jgi:hypothetical protein
LVCAVFGRLKFRCLYPVVQVSIVVSRGPTSDLEIRVCLKLPREFCGRVEPSRILTPTSASNVVKQLTGRVKALTKTL